MAASVSRGSATAVCRIPKFHPYGRMIACAFHSAGVAVDASLLHALSQRGTQQKVIETQAAIAFPTVPLVIPERVHRLLGMKRANRIAPALR